MCVRVCACVCVCVCASFTVHSLTLSKHKYNNVYLSVVRFCFHYFWTRSGTLHCPKRPYVTPTATASTTILYPLKVLACPKVSSWSHVKTEHPLDIFIRMGTCQSYGNSAHRCWTEVVLNSKFMNTGTRTGLLFGVPKIKLVLDNFI